MKYLWSLLGVLAILAVAAVLNGLLRPLEIHYEATPDKTAQPAPQIDAPFVGLALSGGGARAAIFAAAGMEALSRHGQLSAVTHVSSVSGGGFPASYLALNPPGACVGAGGDADCSDSYFAAMKDVVGPSNMYGLDLRQIIYPWRILSPSYRLTSLQDVLNTPAFLAGRTFKDMPKDRHFFFNTVSYDTGQPFVLSNAALPANSTLPDELRSLSFGDVPTLDATPDDLNVSFAVATSAAFPPYVGPATIEVSGDPDRYVHLGDGGIFENTGIATLREVLLAEDAPRSATIYVFNAGLALDQDLSSNTHDISIWSRDVSRLVDVLITYAGRYRDALLDGYDRDRGADVEIVEFNYRDLPGLIEQGLLTPVPNATRSFESWQGWRGICRPSAQRGYDTPADLLLEIPTRLSITPCHKQLIDDAATALVDRHFANPAEN